SNDFRCEHLLLIQHLFYPVSNCFWRVIHVDKATCEVTPNLRPIRDNGRFLRDQSLIGTTVQNIRLLSQDDQAMHVFEQTCIGAIWQKTGEDYILWFLCQHPGRSLLQVATYIEGHLRQKSRCSKNLCYRLIIMKAADYSHTC